MSSLTLFVGIDVSKDTLDVAVRPTAETWQVANETADIGTLVAQLEAMAPALVVLEATGGFERPLLAALAVDDPCGACASTPGPGLCPSHRHLGDNSSNGCACAGSLCGSGQTRAACPA